jgi:hypothetical protein
LLLHSAQLYLMPKGRPKSPPNPNARTVPICIRVTQAVSKELGLRAQALKVSPATLAADWIAVSVGSMSVQRASLMEKFPDAFGYSTEPVPKDRGFIPIDTAGFSNHEKVLLDIVTKPAIEETKEQKLARLAALIPPETLATDAPAAEPEPDAVNDTYLTLCGVGANGTTGRGCGGTVERDRWIRRDGRDNRRGNKGGCPFCSDCAEMQ